MQIKNLLLFMLTVLLLVALMGCGGAAQEPLEGTSWVLTSYAETNPLPGTRITLSFQEGQAGGSAGCNSYGGAYQVTGDKIAIGPMAITEMACLEPAGVMDQETTFVQLLQAGQRFELQDGKLLIFNADGQALILEPQE